MNCTACNHPVTRAGDSRVIDGIRIRRRVCVKCRVRFDTREVADFKATLLRQRYMAEELAARKERRLQDEDLDR